MYAKKEPGPDVLALARRQAGVVSRQQLVALDAPTKARRRWASQWTTMAPGYYCLAEPTWQSWCWAGLLRAGPDGMLGGAAAGHLHGFVKDEPTLITVVHPRDTAVRPMLDGSVAVVFRRGNRRGRGVPARTSVEDTLLDCTDELDETGIVAAVTRALADGMTTPSRLDDALGARVRVRGRALLEEVCATGGIESALEWRFLTRVVRPHGLPEPTRQVRLEEGMRSDAYWDGHGLVAELDGRLGHEDVFRDMARDNRLVVQGLATLRYGWTDVSTRACAVAAQVHQVLALYGYGGRFTRCVACRRARSTSDR